MKRLAVFARPPVLGAVKTRLSPALPAPLALALHRAMLADALAAAAAARADERTLWWSDPPPPDAPPAPPGFATALQRGADLGERLAGAFEGVLDSPGDRAVAIGADCPELDAAVLDEAFARLADHDLALVPAEDGGYALIALARPAPALFRGIDWSTPRVLAQTLARARDAGLRVATLPPLTDLDTPDALARWLARAAFAPRERAPHTRAALVALGLLPGD